MILSFAIECATNDSMDAFVLLQAQTVSPAERYTRDYKFFTEAWKGLRVQPAIVEKPNGKPMFGVVAELSLKKVGKPTPPSLDHSAPGALCYPFTCMG